MVAGRAHGAEGVAALARHHRIDRGDDAAGGAQGGLARAGRNRGVAVDHGAALARDRAQDAIDMGFRMAEGEQAGIDRRRGAAQQGLELGRVQGRGDRAQPVRPLGVAVAGIVFEAGGVGIEECGHGCVQIR